MVGSNHVFACLAALLCLFHQISGFVVPDELVPKNLIFRDPESEGRLVINEDVLNELLKTLYSPSRTTVRADKNNDKTESKYETEEDGYEENLEKYEEDDRYSNYQANKSNRHQQRTNQIFPKKSSWLLQKKVQPHDTVFRRQMKQRPTYLFQSKDAEYYTGSNQNPFVGIEESKVFESRGKDQNFASGTQDSRREIFMSPNSQLHFYGTTQQPLEINDRQIVQSARPVFQNPTRPESEHHHQQLQQQQQHQQQQHQHHQQQQQRRRFQIGQVTVRRTS